MGFDGGDDAVLLAERRQLDRHARERALRNRVLAGGRYHPALDLRANRSVPELVGDKAWISAVYELEADEVVTEREPNRS